MSTISLQSAPTEDDRKPRWDQWCKCLERQLMEAVRGGSPESVDDASDRLGKIEAAQAAIDHR